MDSTREKCCLELLAHGMAEDTGFCNLPYWGEYLPDARGQGRCGIWNLPSRRSDHYCAVEHEIALAYAICSYY
jgi:hypothetical protein